MNYTLAEWQTIPKLQEQFIIQASSTDGKDTMQPFPIGMGYQWKPISLGTHDELLLTTINPTSDKATRWRQQKKRSTRKQQ